MASSAVTVENDGSVTEFLDGVTHPVRRRDAFTVLALMERVTGEPARMWGTSIVGFGSYHFVYASGREGDWLALGFSPRKAATTVYLKDLTTIDLDVLEELARTSYAAVVGREG